MNMNYIDIPGSNEKLYSGSRIRLDRFDSEIWVVQYGWYAWGNNKPVCGWYLSEINSSAIKPLNFSDFDDIVLIET